MNNNEFLKIFKQNLINTVTRIIRRNAKSGNRVSTLYPHEWGWTKQDIDTVIKFLKRTDVEFDLKRSDGHEGPVDPLESIIVIKLSGDGIRD